MSITRSANKCYLFFVHVKRTHGLKRSVISKLYLSGVFFIHIGFLLWDSSYQTQCLRLPQLRNIPIRPISMWRILFHSNRLRQIIFCGKHKCYLWLNGKTCLVSSLEKSRHQIMRWTCPTEAARCWIQTLRLGLALIEWRKLGSLELSQKKFYDLQ